MKYARLPLSSLLSVGLFSIVLLCSLPICAQDKTHDPEYYRERGLALLQNGEYADAYLSLDYYLKHAPVAVRQSTLYAQLQQQRSRAYASLENSLKSIYSSAESALKHNKPEAGTLFDQYLAGCVTPALQKTYKYSVALTQKALSLQRSGNIQAALDSLNRVIDIRTHGEYIDYVHAAETYNLIAAIHNQQGHYDEAIKQGEKALDIYDRRYGKKHEQYAITLSNLASYYTSRNAPGDRQHAVALGEEAIRSLPKKSPAYAHAINNLIVYYSFSGEKVKASKYAKIAKKAMKVLEKSSMNYASALSNQAVHLANAANYAQAAEYAHEAIAIYEQHNETQSLNFARLLSNTASFEKHNENYAEAIALWQRAAEIYERIQTRNGSGYLDCMSEISAAYTKMGNLELAANVNVQMTSQATQDAKYDAHYAHSLCKRASIMAADGNYHQAIVLESQAIQIFRNRKEQADVASSLSDISNYLYHLGDTEAAIDTCQQALMIYESLPGHNEDKGLALNNLSMYYYSQGKTDLAIQASRRASQLFETANRTETSLFAKVLANQALYEAARDSLQSAISLSAQAEAIQQRILGPQHPDNVMLTFNQAVYHIRKGDTIPGQQLFHQAMTQQMSHVRNNFSHLSTRGRELYWGTKSYVFHYAPYVACLLANNDSARIDAYNSLLFTKGLLLNSEVDFRKLLAHKADEELQEKYSELEATRQQIEDIWRAPTQENRAELDLLQSEATRLEREIIRGCKEYGDFTAAMNIDVSQVVKSLPSDGAAIEFFDIETQNGDRAYWALVVRKDNGVPQLVHLFNLSELNSLMFDGLPLQQALTQQNGINQIYNDEHLGRLVWEPLMSCLHGIHSVWFSPSGLFYQLGIEYFYYEGQRMIDHLAMHRVSSTKQLVEEHTRYSADIQTSSPSLSVLIKHAAVFGGLDYDATPDELRAANNTMKEQSVSYLKAYLADNADRGEDLALAESHTRDAMARAGLIAVEFLEGTENEAHAISDILFMQDVDVDIYERERGSEEAFKSLSGSGVRLLHVATHGFTLSEETVEKNQSDLMYLGLNGESGHEADNSLCYAGLLMAGANNTLKHTVKMENMENGILTAREIASMNLCDLQLVVLSACQTGLGQLRDDGVFGLQRGFKKAGARTLLMSLWSVDDLATQTMMTAFYEELVNGSSRRKAFHKAQNRLRADARFSDPIYWASFIMLDD